MKIIISPAKKMKESEFSFNIETAPHFINESNLIRSKLMSFSTEDLKEVYTCSDAIAKSAYSLLRKTYSVQALLAYDGIQYKYLSANTLKQEELDYLSNNLFILSALYGALKPTDLINFYRLELINNLLIENKNLYEFWTNKVAQYISSFDEIIINLCSKEYSKLIEPFVNKDKFVNVYFYEKEGDKLVEKGVYAKMARGAMVKYLAQNQISDIQDIKNFNDLGYKFDEKISDLNNLKFVRFSNK